MQSGVSLAAAAAINGPGHGNARPRKGRKTEPKGNETNGFVPLWHPNLPSTRLRAHQQERVPAKTKRPASLLRRKAGLHKDKLLPGYTVRILDGNHLAASERRIRELRDIAALLLM